MIMQFQLVLTSGHALCLMSLFDLQNVLRFIEPNKYVIRVNQILNCQILIVDYVIKCDIYTHLTAH